jgi:hypothetical protein
MASASWFTSFLKFFRALLKPHIYKDTWKGFVNPKLKERRKKEKPGVASLHLVDPKEN